MRTRPGLSGNRRLLLVRSQEDESSLELPGWDLIPLVVNRVVTVPATWIGVCDAVVVTSRNAVPWLAQAMEGFEGPVGVSGPATATKVREAGFRCVVPETWGGEGALRALDLPVGSKVLFPCGTRTAGSVERVAQALELELIRVEVYRLESCSPTYKVWFGDVEGVIFLSGQMVRHFQESTLSSRSHRLQALPAFCTPSARVELVALGWEGPLRLLEKKEGQEDLSRLLLKAVVSHMRSGEEESAMDGVLPSDAGMLK